MTSTYRDQVTEEIDKIPAEYLPTVLQVIRAFRESVTFKNAEASLQQGWQEALDGDTHPVAELWTDLDAKRFAGSDEHHIAVTFTSEIKRRRVMRGDGMKHKLTIEYGGEILAGLGLSPDEFAREAGFLLAAKLDDLGRLSSGQAARLCDIARVDFLLSLSRIGIHASNLRPEDAKAEPEFAHGS